MIALSHTYNNDAKHIREGYLTEVSAEQVWIVGETFKEAVDKCLAELEETEHAMLVLQALLLQPTKNLWTPYWVPYQAWHYPEVSQPHSMYG